MLAGKRSLRHCPAVACQLSLSERIVLCGESRGWTCGSTSPRDIAVSWLDAG